MTPWQQILTIARLELGRVFFSKRSFWVYGLAIFPAVIFGSHALEAKLRIKRWSAMQTPAAALSRVTTEMTEDEVLQLTGKPMQDFTRQRRVRREEGAGQPPQSWRHMVFFDGKRRVDLTLEGGRLTIKNAREVINFEEDRRIYAGMFQMFYLRLGIFFGCLGIFINLFRGEMLDRSLHFWFLAPVKREVLLLGKYLAGLTAAAAIFGGAALLSFLAMVLPHEGAEVQAYWQTVGPEHAFWYVAAAVLGCVGYGSVFLAAGLLLRNPIVPAIVMLLWESVNGFLPEIMQKLSVLHYLQSLCPVPMAVPDNVPDLLKLLVAPAEATSAPVAALGLVALTALVLFAAMRAVRRLEINYGTE